MCLACAHTLAQHIVTLLAFRECQYMCRRIIHILRAAGHVGTAAVWPLDMITASPDDKVTSHWITTGEFSPIFVARTRVDVKSMHKTWTLCQIATFPWSLQPFLQRQKRITLADHRHHTRAGPTAEGGHSNKSPPALYWQIQMTTNSSTNKTLVGHNPATHSIPSTHRFAILVVHADQEDPLGGLSKAWALVPWNANPLTP